MVRAFDLGSSFGIMQGRLSAQTPRGYQAFPWETWQQEFDLAQVRGLEHVEWVLDSLRVEDNPILRETGDVVERMQTTGVRVVSVCADYLMDRPLDVADPDSWTVLHQLIDVMAVVGARWLVVPCVDQASLRDSEAQHRLLRATDRLAKVVQGSGVHVSLEADLAPQPFATLLSGLDTETFGVNYDIGNSASLGYQFQEEFDAYGHRVSLVHIKDRILGGSSVPLGQGSADVAGVLERMRKMEFNGAVTMQAFRDTEGLAALDAQLSWLQSQICRGD